MNTTNARPPLRSLTLDELAALPPTEPLVDEMLDEGGSSALFGPPGSGKSFVALDLAYCVAKGRPFFGRETEQGAVLYAAAHGHGGLPKRIAALQDNHCDLDDAPLSVAMTAVDLRQGGDADRLIDAARRAAAAHGHPVRLIVIDGPTLDVAARDLPAVLANVDRIREETGSHVCLIHHSPPPVSMGVEMRLSVASGGFRTLTVTRQPDHPTPPPITFWLDVVLVGSDKTCVVSTRPPAYCSPSSTVRRSASEAIR